MKIYSALVSLIIIASVLGGCATFTVIDKKTNDKQEAVSSVIENDVKNTEKETTAETKKSFENTEETISKDEAVNIALSHAQLKKEEVKLLFSELDFDDKILKYEVEFRKGTYEYDYEINANTGEIISFDKDIDD